ncbi:hypothetical protein KKG46_05560 [Patescibacteria group bacterium]|nr:hypothetical protein [Patescibacteria group bacterium]
MKEQALKDALVHLIGFEVIGIRQPTIGFPIPVQLDFESMEVIPAVRKVVLDLIFANVDPKSFGVVAASRHGCRSLAPLVANHFSLPFLLSETLPTKNGEVIDLYGKSKVRPRVLLIQEFASDGKDVETMAHVLSMAGYSLATLFVLFHADCELELCQAVSRVNGGVEVKMLFPLSMVLRVLRDDPDFSQLINLDLERVFDHYIQYLRNRDSQS